MTSSARATLLALRDELPEIAAGENVDEVGDLAFSATAKRMIIVSVGTFRPRSIWLMYA